jgi:hypothetical protein
MNISLKNNISTAIFNVNCLDVCDYFLERERERERDSQAYKHLVILARGRFKSSENNQLHLRKKASLFSDNLIFKYFNMDEFIFCTGNKFVYLLPQTKLQVTS